MISGLIFDKNSLNYGQLAHQINRFLAELNRQGSETVKSSNYATMSERKITSTNYRNQAYLEEKCTLNELLDLVSKRWFTDVLFCIEEGNNRFKLIKDDLKYISDTILSDRLKLLEKYGLITRTDYVEIPPKVEYALTGKGTELSRLLDLMCHFSETIIPIPSKTLSSYTENTTAPI
jgi:DNA-binding HxlR family transcriptional regulator